MTDRELFQKYNLIDTDTHINDENLTQSLKNGTIKPFDKSTKIQNNLLILLHGTYACNANCVYCENGDLRKKYGNKLITKDTLEQLIRKMGPYIREITWHGGEPLLVPEELIIYLEDLKKEYGYDFPTTLQTNAILLDDDKQKLLNELNIQIGSSFDGIHNDISRGKASTTAVLNLIKEHKLPGFICVSYKDTITELIDNYNYYKSLGASNIQACVIREIVLNDDNPLLVPNDIAITEVLKYIDYWIHDTESPLRDDFVMRQISRVLGSTHVCDDGFCIGGWLILDPLGNFGFCGHAADDGFICNINDIEDGKDLLYSKKYLNTLGKQVKLVKSCKDCEWYHVCYGGCMGLNYEWDHTYQSINKRNCDFTKGILEGVYELIKDIDITRTDIYNPIFLDMLRAHNYYSLSEIKKIEGVN